MRVRDVMSRAVVTIEPSESCQEAVARMHRARVRHLPVVERDGTLVGVVTDRDLRHHLLTPRIYRELGTVAVDVLLRAVPVSEIMAKAVVCTDADEDLVDAARLMLEDKVGSLPVVAGGRVVGILTETDLLRQICRVDAAAAPETEIIIPYP